MLVSAVTTLVVGRERELAEAGSALLGVREGSCALVIEGEPGIGKTAVWSAIAAEVARQGFTVLACRSSATDAQTAFAGLCDLLDPAPDSVLAALPALQREALESALLPESWKGRAPDPRTVAVAFRSVLIELARCGPVAVAVDDVQWLDPPTARALTFAARRLDGHRVCLLGTLRTPVTTSDPLGLRQALGDRSSVLRLGPLNLGSIRALLENRLGRSYSRPVLARIAEASGGNPLFALEIGRAFDSAPPGQAAQFPVPESLQEVVAARIDGLGPTGREAMLAAAALSRPTVDLVERAASASGLAAAEEVGLLRVAEGRVTFAHPLHASAVYISAATRRRRDLHERLAALVPDAEERARHLALAAAEPSEEVAAALDEAALLARSRGSWEAAGELLELARSLTPASSPAVARDRGIRAAEHHAHAGDRARARRLLEEILAEITSGAQRADALRLLGQISYHDENFAEGRRLLVEALGQAESPELLVAIQLALSYTSVQLWDFTSAAGHAEQAFSSAHESGDSGLVAAALGFRAMTGYLDGRGVDWKLVEQSLELEDPTRIGLLWRPSTISAMLHLYVGRFAEARGLLVELRARTSEVGDESDLALLVFWLAWLETMNGNFDAALAFAEEAATLSTLTGSESSHAWVLTQRAFTRAHRGEVLETRRDCDDAARIAARTRNPLPTIWMAAALGLLGLSLGDPRAAWRACAPLVELVEEHGVGEPVAAFYLPEALEALVALGELERAEALLDRFEERAGELDRAWALARGARCRALLLAARGDVVGAAEAIERALAEHQRIEMPFELARTLLVQGQIRRRQRQKRSAAESFSRALELFERLGAPLWVERTRVEIERLGMRRAPGALTATEERVASLAATGMTNREIAATLFISPKTVQANLARAYTKLGVGSRAELGARMSRPLDRSTDRLQT